MGLRHFVGTKIVRANEQERDGQPGYQVVYPDGYISWSPKDVFEGSYLQLGELSHLEDWQQRLVGEYIDISKKLEKLDTMFADISEGRAPSWDKDYQIILAAQHDAMNRYRHALACRVDRLPLAPEAPKARL